MNINSLDEHELRRAMQPVVASTPPPIDVIEDRAKAQRRRRTRRVAGSVGAGVVCAALVAAGPLHLIGYGPDTAGGPPICTPTELTYYSGEAFGIEPQDLPDSMRLGWSTDTLPPMRMGIARRIEHPCAHAPIHRLIDVNNGVVTRTVDLNATPLVTSTGDLQAGEPPAATPSNGDGVYPTTDDPRQAEIHRNGGSLVAGWLSDGYQYEIWANGLDPQDMQNLLSNVRASGLNINASAWPPSAQFEIQGATEVPQEGTEFSWIVYSQNPDRLDEASLDLEVAEDSDDLMMHAEVGATQTTVGGKPALQSRDGTVYWKPTEGTIAFLDGASGRKELLDAAAQITTMNGDSLPQN